MDPQGPQAPTLPAYRAFDVVGLGASLGGLRALICILSALPAEFPAGIVVVQHLSSRYPSYLVEVLRQHSLLQVKWAEAGDRLRPGCVFVAPRDRHLTIRPTGAFVLSDGPKVQFVRPSADELFSSMASSYTSRAMGVILTGSLRDGAAGVRAIKGRGGRVLAQDAGTAAAFEMPHAAIATGCVDFVLPLAVIPSALVALTMVPGAAALLSVPLRPMPPAHAGSARVRA